MKICRILAALLLFLLWVGNGAAYSVAIDDNYIGADPTGTSWDGKDVIGEASYFDVSRMVVTFESGQMIVDIYTRYLNNIGQYGTELGDLFVSTNGWKPYGEASYLNDNATNGEKWEYALVMGNHSPGVTSGETYLYSVEDAGLKSSWAPSGYIYRENQEVQYNSIGGQTMLATGSWNFNWGSTSQDTDDYLRFVIAYQHFGIVSEYGLHWTMSCGNDVIEGSATAPVPEPATMLLFGAGLIGVAGFGRKRLMKKR